MRILRLSLGTLYPSLCIGMTLFVVSSMVDGWRNEKVIAILLIMGIMCVQSFICSSFIDFIINPKIENNILSVFLGGGSWLLTLVIVMFGLDEFDFSEKLVILIDCVVMFFFLLVGLITAVSLRYLFIKKQGYKKSFLFVYLLMGLFMLIGIGFGLYGLVIQLNT